LGGTEADIQDWQRQNLPQQRDPAPHNGFAKELFAGDLLAVKTGRLSHQFEEDEKMLLRIGENFGLRGPEIDKLNLAALDKAREKAVKDALGDLKRMTMTVIDGDFPREVVGAQNLIFGECKMPARRNSAEFYDAKDKKPAGKREGTLKLGALEPAAPRGGAFRLGFITLGALLSVGLLVLGLALTLKPPAGVRGHRPPGAS
jgi:hypothetical protein